MKVVQMEEMKAVKSAAWLVESLAVMLAALMVGMKAALKDEQRAE